MTPGRYRRGVGIPDEEVAQVRSATDIVALISEHAALKKVGRRWSGLCPFHTEKTPSFSVNAEEGFYYCFGCHASGDAISFVRAMDHLDFVDAVRFLADRAGLTLHEDSEAGRDHKRRSELLDAMERAVAWYHQRLLSAPDAGLARDYLRSRGYDGEVVRQFRLGWAPDDWDALAKALKLPEKVLSDSGSGFRQSPRPTPGLLPGPGAVPHLRSLGTARRPGRTHPAATSRGGITAAARAEVQELTGVADLFEASHALRAQLGEARCHRAR